MKTKIAYCLPSLYIPGGMERVLTIKANYFADVLGYEVYLILTDGKNLKPYYQLSDKVQLVYLNINFDQLWNKNFIHKTALYLYKQMEYKRKLKKALYTIKPDITVSMLRREINFINSIKDGSIKIGELHINRENFRKLNEESKRTFFNRYFSELWMNQLIKQLKKLDMFVTLSNEDASKWKELNKIKVINNPLPFFPEERSECSSKKVIAVGRYAYQKGFDLLIKSWKVVALKHPDWELHIYGGGERDEFIKKTVELDIHNSCFMESAVNNINDKYLDSSIFVLSSRYEGFGMVIIEAMACGVPAISFTCPSGPRDIIKDGIDGLLVENGNTKELANKICYLIENEEIRKEMGKQAKINVERFKIENIALQWQELFESLISSRK